MCSWSADAAGLPILPGLVRYDEVASGTWFRLKVSVDPSRFDPAVRPIVVALQKYGAIVADNGSAWYLSGVPDARWNNDLLATLGRIKGSDFQAVDSQSLIVDPNSGQATTAS
jgi:hypothetical protein